MGQTLGMPEQPLEILRTIHSFDACMVSAIHVVNLRGKAKGRAFGGLICGL